VLTILLAAALGTPPGSPDAAPEAQKLEVTAPRQIAGSISDADYPAEAIRQGAQGTTEIRITVDPSGAVERCETEQSSGHAALDAASCQLVTSRFRYEPARTSSGTAITATISRRITWRLPHDVPITRVDVASALPLLKFAPGLLRVTLGGTATERPRCAAEAIGSAFEPHLPLQCFGLERAELAELAKAPKRVVTILRLQPEGTRPPPPSEVTGGTLASASAATIEVDPQGRIMQCTPVAVEQGSLGETSGHLCDSLYPGVPAFDAPGGSTNRRAAYQLEVYRIDADARPAT